MSACIDDADLLRSPWRDNPLVQRAWRRRWHWGGMRLPRIPVAAAAGVPLAAMVLSFRVLLPPGFVGQVPTLIGQVAMVALVMVSQAHWASSVKQSGLLRDLHLAGASTRSVAHGLMLDFLLPFVACSTVAALLACGAAFFEPTFEAGIFDVFMAAGLFLAPFSGVVMGNCLSYAGLAWENLQEYAGHRGRAGFFAITALAVLSGMLMITALIGVLSIVALALVMCLATGDGVKGYLPQFAHEPMFDELYGI